MPIPGASRPAAMAMVAAMVLVATACTRPEPSAPVVRSVKTQVVTAGATTAALSYAGEIRAQMESRLGFRVAGKISRKLVEPGQSVRAGQPLMEIDAADYRLAQEAAAAQVIAARADRDQATADLKRYNELFAQGFIGAAELERRRTAAQAAQARLDQAQAQAAGQANQTRYSVLLADADGVVLSVDAEPGQVVAAGTPVLRLARQGPRDVVFSVPEDQISNFKLGSRLNASIWSRPGQVYEAKVREMAAAADAVTRTFQVRATLPNDEALKLGMTAHVQWQGDAAQVDTLRVPLSALTQHNGQSAVWVWNPQSRQVAPQAVTVRGFEANEAVIDQGLEAGQVVVVAGTHVLQTGMEVKPLPAGGAPAGKLSDAGAGTRQSTPGNGASSR